MKNTLVTDWNFPQDPTNDNSALVHVMVPSGNKQLPEPILNQFYVAI